MAVALKWRWNYAESNPDVGWTTIEIIFDTMLLDPLIPSQPNDREKKQIIALIQND